MNQRLMTFAKLGFFAFLVQVASNPGGCSGCPNPIIITKTAGDMQSAPVKTKFPTNLQVNVNGDTTTPYAVTFTAPSTGASGTFANGKNTESDTIDSNGNATSSLFTANGTAGPYQVTVSGPKGTDVGPPKPVNFSLTNTSGPPGTFNVAGVVSNSSGAGVSGVTITLSGSSTGQTTTASDGSFSFSLANGSYTLTPSLAGGYAFSPTSLPVTVNGANMPNQNFTVSGAFAISGVVSNSGGAGVPGVTVALSGSATGQATTASDGSYSLNVANGTYTLTPSLAGGYAFSPTNLPVTVNGANMPNQNFTVSGAFSISGAVSGAVQSGVTITLSGASSAVVTTGSSGSYVFAGLVNGTYTVTPSLTGYSFTPPSIAVPVNGANMPNQNFAASRSAGTQAFPRYLFEVNGDTTISTYAVVPSTGQLRSVTYLSTSASPGPPISAALHPNGTVLYTVQPLSVGQSFVTYSVSPGGVLSQLVPSATPTVTYGQLLVDPLGRFLWIVDHADGLIISTALDPTTGAPGVQIPAVNVANVSVIAVDPTGTYLFSEDTSGNVSTFTISPTNGALTSLGTPPSSHPFQEDSMVVDPSGKYLYAMDNSSLNRIFGYTITNTGLISMSNSPFNVPNNGGVDTQMAIDPTSSFLYAVDISSPMQPIDAFAIGAGGALTSITETLQVPSSPSLGTQQINVDPTGKFLFVSYGGAHEVWTYSITPAGGTNPGTLTLVNRMRLRSDTSFINAQLLSAGKTAVQFTPQALYITNSGSFTVSQFSITPSTGALTSLGPPLGVGNQPEGIAVLPDNSFAYVGYFSQAELATFSITNDVLSSVGQPAITGVGPTSLTIDLSGSYLYNVNAGDSDIWEYPIGSGMLSTGTKQQTTDAAPVFVTTEPTGQFIYTANSGAGTINAFSIVLPGGGLHSSGPSVGANGPNPSTNWIAIDPSGRFLYSASIHSNALSEFLITAGSGLPTANSNPYLLVGPASDSGAGSVVVEPTGKYVYASNQFLNQIFAYSIDPTTGLLTAIRTKNPDNEVADTGTSPVALAVDISGQYLYCVNSGSNDINIYEINLADGSLTPVGTGTVPTGGATPVGIALSGTIQ